MFKPLIALLLSMISFELFAGGSFQPVSVEALSINGNDVEMTLKLGQDDQKSVFTFDSSNCKHVVISGEFDSIRWQNVTLLIDEQRHAEALKHLSQAFETGATINVGFVGTGFKRLANCHYESKGLVSDSEAIVSIHTL